MKYAIVLLASFNMMSCSDSDFSSGGSNKNNNSGNQNPAIQNPYPNNNNINNTPMSGDGSRTNGPNGTTLTQGEIDGLKTQCWFAVSGAFLNSTYYATSFPNTKSGRPIAHNEIFDDVGGVFLEARDTEYNETELAKAIEYSFDSIAIAPGMRAVIKDASGNVLYQGDGPQLFLASSDASQNNSRAYAIATADSQRDIAKFPDWMQTLLRNTNYRPPQIPLHDGRKVLVTKIAGQKCDFISN